MPRPQVSDAVDARLAAEWVDDHCIVAPLNTSPEAPTDEDGNSLVDVETGDVEPFLQVQYGGDRTRWFVLDEEGPGWNEGIILFKLFTPRSGGTALANEWSNDLFGLFHRKSFDGVQCLDASPRPLDDDADRGNYFESGLSVSYRYNFNTDEE